MIKQLAKACTQHLKHIKKFGEMFNIIQKRHYTKEDFQTRELKREFKIEINA